MGSGRADISTNSMAVSVVTVESEIDRNGIDSCLKRGQEQLLMTHTTRADNGFDSARDWYGT